MTVTAIIPFMRVGSSTPMIDIASTSGGMDRNTSVARIRANRTHPLKYPAVSPTVTPTGTASARTTTPSTSESL